MWFVTFLLANLWGRRTRSLLTLSGVAIAVAAVVSLLGVVRGFESSLLEVYEKKGIDLLVHQAGRVQMTSSVLPERLAEPISQLPGVRAAYPSLIDVLSLIEDDMMGVPIQGWPVGSQPLQRLNISEGRVFGPDDSQVVILGSRLASALDKHPGDAMELIDGAEYTVIGVFESYNVFDSGSVVTRLQDLQSLLLRNHEITFVGVTLEDSTREGMDLVQSHISAFRDGLQVDPVRDLAEKSTEIRVARSFAWLTSSIALLIGSIGMLNTLMMAVFERTREIAMLRALGWRRRRIVAMVLGEAAVLCASGAVVGIVLAWLGVRALSGMPEAGRLVAGNISWAVALQGFGLAITLGLLGGLYPAWLAARMTPAQGLRHD